MPIVDVARNWSSLEHLQIRHFLHVSSVGLHRNPPAYYPIVFPNLKTFVLEDIPSRLNFLLNYFYLPANVQVHIIASSGSRPLVTTLASPANLSDLRVNDFDGSAGKPAVREVRTWVRTLFEALCTPTARSVGPYPGPQQPLCPLLASLMVFGAAYSQTVAGNIYTCLKWRKAHCAGKSLTICLEFYIPHGAPDASPRELQVVVHGLATLARFVCGI